jgi:hypothetical protein
MLAANVYITDADWHDRYHRVFPPGPTAPVVLGSNVWVGAGAILLKGVQIGDNSIVGAGSVVLQSVPANVVIAGNPGKVVAQLDTNLPTTDRRGLFEELDFTRFDEDFWRQRLAGNSLVSWLAGLLWTALRCVNASVRGE